MYRALNISKETLCLGLVVTWVLMIPLMSLALGGQVRLDTYTVPPESHLLIVMKVASTSVDADVGNRAINITAFAICCLLICTQLRKCISTGWRSRAFVALFLLAVVSSAWSQDPGLSLKYGIIVAINILFAFYLTGRFAPFQQMELFLILGWILMVSSIVAALLFPQYGVDHRVDSGAWIGIYNQKNGCAMVGAFLLPGVIYMRSSGTLFRFARLAYILLALFLILMSRSRSGWIVTVCLLAFMIVMELIKKYSEKDRIAVLAVIATVSVLLGSVFALYYKAITLLIGKDPTLTGRTELWKVVFISGMKHPLFGFGYHAFWSVMQGEAANIAFAVLWVPMYAHNGFLDVWLNLGALGLAMVVYSMLRALGDAFVCLNREWTPFVGWYLCIIVLTILYNLSEETLMLPNNLGWVMYVMACVGLNNEKRRVRELRIK